MDARIGRLFTALLISKYINVCCTANSLRDTLLQAVIELAMLVRVKSRKSNLTHFWSEYIIDIMLNSDVSSVAKKYRLQ